MGAPLNVESWIWYALALSLVSCRVLSRTLLLGSVAHLKIDDWLMLLVIAPYTVLIVTINIVAHTSSNLLEPGVNIDTFTPADRDERVYGSKLILVVEQMQLTTVWGVKACLLILYYRLTYQLPVNLYVKALAVFVGVSFLVMEILYFGVWCRPISNYWALPTPNTQCNAATNHLITNAVFNLSSDVVMLTIGCSLFIRTKLPWDRKLILSCIFGLGIFVILAAVLNKYYSFSHPFGSQWTFWYVRESSTAILVANLPFLWTLLRRMFKLDAFDGETASLRTVPYHSSRSARGRHATQSRNSGTHTDNAPTWHDSHIKHGSQSSSVDMKQIPLSAITNEPNSSAKPQPPAHKPSWREQGLFGRGDLELMADIDPWDKGHDLKIEGDIACPSTPPPRANVASIRHSLSSGGSQSPRRDSRRLRDEEAQYAIQENVGSHFQYYDGPPDSEIEEVEDESERVDMAPSLPEDFKGKDLEFETSALETGEGAATETADSRKGSDGSKRRRSLVNKMAPPLWSGA